MKNLTALSLLKHDHDAVKKLFAEIASHSKDTAKTKPLFEEIKAALTVHAAIEEEIFYPAVKKARSGQVKDEVREGYEEHKQIKSLLEQIAKLPASHESYSAKLTVLKEDVEHHVAEEEGQMFPDAIKYLGETKLAGLGEEMQARKLQLEKKH